MEYHFEKKKSDAFWLKGVVGGLYMFESIQNGWKDRQADRQTDRQIDR